MTTMTTETPVDAENLSNELWRERGTLENLLYKFTTQTLLVTNGHSRWLGRCVAELESQKSQLASTQLTIDVISRALGEKWGLAEDAEPTLANLIEAAPEGPWSVILSEHRDAINSLVEEIRTASEESMRFLKAANIALQDAGQSTSGPVAYNASGTASRIPGAALVDRAG